MPSTIYALVDCNNFYVSCERAFNPKLIKRPVIVLSSNDGCIISRSNEAKKLGIPMGVPFFKVREIVNRYNIQVLSSNFTLYGDLSMRVMNIIMQELPNVTIYSIDEAFIEFTDIINYHDVYQSCLNLVHKIEQYTAIPVSIGIASTKTLAKMANHLAKTQDFPNRICALDNDTLTKKLLANINIKEIWGIGRKLKKKLNSIGIVTGQDLTNIPIHTQKKMFNITLQRTILELQGIACIPLRDTVIGKQRIMVSRSFSSKISELPILQQALITYVSIACEKMRKQGSAAGGLYVFLQTSQHDDPYNVYRSSAYTELAVPSYDTRIIAHFAKQTLESLFKPGYKYKKTGIILCNLININTLQNDLFAQHNLTDNEKLMHTIDNINKKFGAKTIQILACGLKPKWQPLSQNKSNNFTTCWQELPVALLD